LIDGDNGLGHLVMRRAAALAIQKATTTGIGWVGARMSNHAGPAALYVTMPLAHDMIGLYFAVGSNHHLPPWGGSESLLGTNPMAVAVPALEEPPIVLDMAPTVAAYGKVRLKAQRGEAMPVGWMMIDREGKPLTDPKRADEGHLLPIGGYKGYGLSRVACWGAQSRGSGTRGNRFRQRNRQGDQYRPGDHGVVDRGVHAAG
jgi:LDH2 family malate/lactate/ureidoglycolate dehydrogenase